MPIYSVLDITAVDEFNIPIPDAVFSIVKSIGGGDAILYTDRSGTDTLSNPILANEIGRITAYLEPGGYHVTVQTPFGVHQRLYDVWLPPEVYSTDICEYDNSAYNLLGAPISGSSLTIQNPALALADIYSDPSGLVTTMNPILSGAGGVVNFFINSGRYVLTAVAAGGVSAVFADVLIPGAVISAVLNFNYLCAPLTYDEYLSDDVTLMTRLGTGPHITTEGFIGNGYDSRYVIGSLPSWLASSSEPLSIQATITPLQGVRNDTGSGFRSSYRDVLVTVANPIAPKLQIVIMDDEKDTSLFQVAVRSYDGAATALKTARRDWHFERQFPLLNSGGFKARPQAIAFIDDKTIISTAHYNYEFSYAYKINSDTGAVLGSFLFETADGLTVAPKIGSVSKRPSDGTWWFAENESKIIYQIDIDASFSTGKMVVTNTFDVSVMGSNAAIMWQSFGGTEYLLVAEYAETATTYLYVINGSVIGTDTIFSLSDRYKRFLTPKKTQGLALRDGILYVSSNNPAATTAYFGVVYTADVAAMIASSADGATMAIINQFTSASAYPEDIAVHPVTGRIWMQTEGLTDFESHDGFLSIWSGDVDGSPQENHYTASYASGLASVSLNNRFFDSFAITPTIVPETVAIGGPATESANQRGGFSIAKIKNVLIKNGPITKSDYENATSGAFEPNTLTEYVVTLTNPGAESGVTGWTNEVGSIDTRSADPAPHTGTAYFNGGSNAQTTARQRHSLETVTGLTGAEIDAASMWARSGWWQASWDNVGGTSTDEDTAGVGIRFLNSASSQISLTYPGLIRMDPRLTWFERATSVLVPSGARSIDSVYRAVRSSGTNNDGRIDDIKLIIYKQ